MKTFIRTLIVISTLTVAPTFAAETAPVVPAKTGTDPCESKSDKREKILNERTVVVPEAPAVPVKPAKGAGVANDAPAAAKP